MSAFQYNNSEINQLLLEYLPKKKGLQETVIRAMDEAVENGGKRIRPILMYEMCRCFAETCGEERESWIGDIAPFMAAMEMIHTFSLIHDDLPCMDNDTLRRGKPTTWYTYGEDMGVLAGDALMLEAMYIVGRCAADSSDPSRAGEAILILGEKSGIRGMLGGQAVDVEQTGKPLNEEQLEFIYRLKTGALIEASLMIGAVIGGATAREAEIAEKIGTNVGIAFQIRDDILDEISTVEELGKPIHSDEKNQKTTYVTLYGLEKAEAEVKRLSAEAEELLEELPGDKEMLRALIRMLTDRSN